MIPIHDISEKKKKEVRMNELATLTDYDSTEAHRHKYFELFVFLKGGGTHVIDFIEFPIHDYSIHIVAPGQVHQVKRELDSNGFVFIFELNLISSNEHVENHLFDHICLGVNELSPSYRFEEDFHPELKDLSERTWSIYNSGKAIRNQLVLNQLSLLILYCLEKENTVQSDDAKNNKIYISFRRLLYEEFRSLKKVKDYASGLNVSEKQLNDIVQQRTGETVSALIFKQLILEAKRLLQTGLSAKEAAYELNFMDPAHFSKFFKTQTGISPSDFKIVHA